VRKDDEMDETKLRNYFGWHGDVDMANKIINRDRKLQSDAKHWQVLAGEFVSITNTLANLIIQNSDNDNDIAEANRALDKAILYLELSEGR
jgi:hypothetical protein